MIDLHLHTNHSDGTDSVVELLKKAEQQNLEIISITDHDNCFAYNELQNAKSFFSGKIIRGVELAAGYGGIEIELLGYGVDPDIINAKANEMREMKKKFYYAQLLELYKICKSLNMKMDENVMDKYVEGEYFYPAAHLHKEITRHKENKKYFSGDEDAWKYDTVFGVRHMGNPASPFYIDVTQYLPTCDYIFDLIKSAGGLVFIPHIFAYNEKSLQVLEYLTGKYQIDGIECFYSRFTPEQTNYLVDFCTRNGYFMSGGSDYHGTYKPDIDIGTGKGNLNISKDITNAWLTNEMLAPLLS